MMLQEFNKIVKEIEQIIELSPVPLKDYVEQYIVVWNKKTEELLDFIVNNKVRYEKFIKTLKIS